MIQKRYAWLPTIVDTWRSSPTKAIIWLQEYYVQKYYVQDSKPYCLRLGTFSHEFY
jgi:hypothetical protein